MTSPLGIALGKDIAGVAQVTDLCKMPTCSSQAAPAAVNPCA